MYLGSMPVGQTTGIAGVTFEGIFAGDLSGFWVSAAGDFNDDGIDDLAIGAIGALERAGQTYLIYGQSGVSALSGILDLGDVGQPGGVAGIVFDGFRSGDASGTAISFGDFNADGIDDLIVGATLKGETCPEPSSTLSFLVLGIFGVALYARRV